MTNARKLTETALLLALGLSFQALRLIAPLFFAHLAGVLIIGSLVNLVLFVAAGRVGLWGTIFIGIALPIFASMQAHLPHIYLVPVVALGNCIIAIVWWLLHTKTKWCSQTISMLIAAAFKFLFLWWAVPFAFRTFLYSGLITIAPGTNSTTILEMLVRNMSWPQLVTAIIGGYLAIIVLRLLPKTLKNK
ncbi:MAG: hypothetical protein FWE47_04350 [Oscillospiraceae bacterium]|nr:hypothetical protein [Oscillospiraceae bacterium]